MVRQRLTMDVAYGHPRKWPQWSREEARGCLRRSWAWPKSREKERESGGVAVRHACGLAHWGSRAALARVLLEVRERERGGVQHGGVMRTSRHLDWREGEARGGRVAWAERSYSA